MRQNARRHFGLDAAQARHLVVTGREGNAAYERMKDEIDVLHKDGSVRPLSQSVDFGLHDMRVDKYYLACPAVLL